MLFDNPEVGGPRSGTPAPSRTEPHGGEPEADARVRSARRPRVRSARGRAPAGRHKSHRINLLRKLASVRAGDWLRSARQIGFGPRGGIGFGPRQIGFGPRGGLASLGAGVGRRRRAQGLVGCSCRTEVNGPERKADVRVRSARGSGYRGGRRRPRDAAPVAGDRGRPAAQRTRNRERYPMGLGGLRSAGGGGKKQSAKCGRQKCRRGLPRPASLASVLQTLRLGLRFLPSAFCPPLSPVGASGPPGNPHQGRRPIPPRRRGRGPGTAAGMAAARGAGL